MGGLNVRVHNKAYGTFNELIQEAEKRLENMRPNYHCVVHGDEHGGNILLSKDSINSRSPDWFVIDYVRAKPCGDWVLSIARMLLWWKVYGLVEEAKEDPGILKRLNPRKCEPKNNRLNMSYKAISLDSQLPREFPVMAEQIKEFALQMAHEFGEDNISWRERLRIALFCDLLNAGLRALVRNPLLAPIMIGEGIMYLYDESHLNF